MPDINQTAPWGKRGQIEYKPNWGQPIVDGQWQGAAVAPALAIDPREVVNTKLGQLRDRLKRWSDTYRATGVDADTYNRNLAVVQRAYNQDKAQLTGTASQLDYIEQIVSAGGISSDTGYEASVRLTMPKEVVDAMFPKEPTPGVTGHTPGTYQALAERFMEVGEASIINPPGWGKGERKHADPERLKNVYFTERRIANLDDPRNVNKIPGFNSAFALAMDQNRHTAKTFNELTNKKTGDMEMIMAFAPTSRLGGIIKDKIQGAPVSPLGRSVWGLVKSVAPVPSLAYKLLAGKRREQGQTRVAPTPTRQFSIGQTIERGGKKYKVVSFDTDGEPMVEETR